MTAEATIIVDADRILGPIDPRIYGQFIEHIGRVIYGGVFEPGSPKADDAGYRLDVLEAARELQPTLLRWPGGNFASGYHWQDGVGPTESRPTRHDLAWDAIETNAFGTEEFLEVCRRLGAEAYVNINASTGTFDEAQAWVEYCNSTHPLPEVARRRTGPHPQAHDVLIWGIGNENYGWWQHMHTSADRYAELTREWGKLLHWSDERIELVGVGSPDPDWNRTVLSVAGRAIDYLSLHFYWHGRPDDRYHAMLAGPILSERAIEAAWETVLEVQRELRLSRPTRLCVDEWGVWETSHAPLGDAAANFELLMRKGITAKAGIDNRFEETYDLKDALAVATWLHVMWRHPEKVALATMAQMVNAIAPIMTTEDGVLRQTVFYPMAVARAHAGHSSLDLTVRTEEGVPGQGTEDGSLPALDAAGTVDGAHVHLSLINRLQDDELVVHLRGVSGRALRVLLHHEDPFAQNTFDRSSTVVPQTEEIDVDNLLALPPHSHTTLVMRP